MVSRRDALPGVSGGTKVVQLVILDFMEAVTGWLELRWFKACAMVWWSRVSGGCTRLRRHASWEVRLVWLAVTSCR